MVPVVIQDLIDKVLDKSKHPEQRQHYAATLRSIIETSEAALKKFEVDKMWKPVAKPAAKRRTNV